jgi:glutamine synthetase
MGEPAKSKFIEWKTAAADRLPTKLGNTVKRGEIIYHHEVTNQLLWSSF